MAMEEDVFKLGTINDMQWTGKLIGGLLGLALGPWGAAVGVALGHQYDINAERSQAPRLGDQFFLSTFRLMGHVAKADGRVTEREIQAARGVMHSLRLNDTQVRLAIAEFTRGKQPQFDLDAEMSRLRAACRSHPEILHVFVEIQLRFAVYGSEMTPATRARVNAGGRIAGGFLDAGCAPGGGVARRAGFVRQCHAGPACTGCSGLPHSGSGSDHHQRRADQGLPAADESPSSRQAQGQWAARFDAGTCQAAYPGDPGGLRVAARTAGHFLIE